MADILVVMWLRHPGFRCNIGARCMFLSSSWNFTALASCVVAKGH